MTHHDLFRRCISALSRFLGSFAAALVVAFQFVALNAYADVPVGSAYDRFRGAVLGNTLSVGFGSTGAPLAYPSGSAPGLFSRGLSPTSGELARYAALSTSYGKVPFSVAQRFPLARLAAVAAGLATGGVGSVALSVALPHVFDWVNSTDLYSADETDLRAFKYEGQIICRVQAGNGVWSDPLPSCASAAASLLHFYAAGTTVECTPPAVSAQVPSAEGTCVFGGLYTQRSVQTFSGLSKVPALPADLAAALERAALSADQLADVLADLAPQPDLLPDAGESVRFSPMSGEQIKSDTKTDTSTTTGQDGSKTEQKKSCYLVGSTDKPGVLSLSEVCTTTSVTTDPSGSVTGSVTTVTGADSGSDAQEEATEDPGFCETLVGKLVCADMDTPDTEVPKTNKDVSYTQEDLGLGGGVCPPPYTWTDHAGSHSIDLAPYCDKLSTVVRPLVLLFGALAAFFIVAGGIREGGM